MHRLNSPTKVVIFLVLFIALPLALACAFAATPAESDHQPPRFLPGIVLYDSAGHFIALQVGTTFSYTCKGALDDSQASIEKATAAGRRLIGLCIPVPTYNAADLVPSADPPKPSPDNAL